MLRSIRSRVAVLEDGVPQVGGRWGADHGALLDPALYGGTEWVPGGGQVWLSWRRWGGVRLKPLGMLGQPGSRTTAGMSHRAGDAGRFHAASAAPGRWRHLRLVSIDDATCPESFAVDVWTLRMPSGNTGGEHACWLNVGKMRNGDNSPWTSGRRCAAGLFPGIIGVPNVDLKPMETASRWTSQPQARRVDWRQMDSPGHPGLHGARVPFAEPRQSAPPRPYGPDQTATSAFNWMSDMCSWRVDGRHSRSFGFQAEHLDGRTSGWEFLLPDHLRTVVCRRRPK